MIVYEKESIDYLGIARAVLSKEIKALEGVKANIDASLLAAARLLFNHTGKIVVTGVGKSGHIAQKIAATFSSTGTPAVFLHPAEAIHGDLGVYSRADPTIMISKSGSTAELIALIPTIRQLNSPIIAILGNIHSPIAQKSDIFLNASVAGEADPLGIVPTASALAAMALGDVLASVLMYLKKFEAKDFLRFHPGGQLGQNLLYKVEEVMHKADKVALVQETTSFKEVLRVMTRFPLGLACVMGVNGELVGIITEGDIRRVLLKTESIKGLIAFDAMSTHPATISPSMLLADALKLMEKRPSPISVLPVVSLENKQLVGVLRLHDICDPKINPL